MDEQLHRPHTTYRKYIIDNVNVWTVMHSMHTDEKLLVPASLVWLSALHDRFSPGISSGAACHIDKREGLLLGLYEVIERDALTIFWESMSAPPILNISTIPLCEKIRAILEKLTRKQFVVNILDITTDLEIPVYCVIIS